MFWRRKNEQGPEIDIPVTPMLDMAFQLLTFFVFTYHPSSLEGQMALSLPLPNGRGEVPAGPHAVLEEVENAVFIRLRTQQGGDGAGNLVFPIELEGPLVKGVSDGVDDLEKFLTKHHKDGRISANARIEADRRLKWAFVVDVMDACKRAGLNVSLAAPADR